MVERYRALKLKQKCWVCCKVRNSGEALIYRGKKPEAKPTWGFCPYHRGLRNKGLIALVEIDNRPELVNDTMDPDEVHRTGVVIYLGINVFHQIFHGDPPDNYVAFVDPTVIAVLQRLKAGTQH